MKHNCVEPRRILICRLSAIGDCIHTIPLAVKIKELWPNCHLTWIVDCAAAQLLQSHTAIDEVIKIERRWVKHWQLWKNLRRDLKARSFDTTFDPQGLSKSSLLAWLSGANTRVGFDYSQARELAPLLANRRVARTARHRVDTYLELLSPWERQEPGRAEFRMPIYAAADKVPATLKSVGLDPHEPYACISPGAGWPSKLWPVQRYAAVVRALKSCNDLRTLVLWAGESEHALAEQIAQACSGAAVVAPRTGLTELAELARRAKLFIASDTGPLHLAAALGTQCVGLFGPTWGDEAGPYGPRNCSIQSPHLPGLSRRMRSGDDSAMRAITVDEVLIACGRLLQSGTRTETYAA